MSETAPKKGSLLKKLIVYPLLLLFVTTILLLVIGLPQTFFTVNTNERAVVLRFGRINRTLGPGAHLRIPFGIEEVISVDFTDIKKLEFGYRSSNYTDKKQNNDSLYEDESPMLTGDLNVADVEWNVQYKISQPIEYIFNVRNVEQNLRDISQSVMREVVGDRSFNEVLNTERDSIAIEVRQRMQTIVDSYKMGVQIDQVNMHNVTPPDKVKASFNAINAASQEAEQIKNQADKNYNEIIPKAEGRAKQALSEAHAYKTDVINRAKGDADRFLALYEEYQKAPEITRRRLVIEKLRQALKKAKTVYVVDPEIKNIVPLMDITGKNP